jgi:hypothetical protein
MLHPQYLLMAHWFFGYLFPKRQLMVFKEHPIKTGVAPFFREKSFSSAFYQQGTRISYDPSSYSDKET